MRDKQLPKLVSLILLILLSGIASFGQEPRPSVGSTTPGWVVAVLHSIDVDKVLNDIRKRPNVRVGVPGSVPRHVINVATGIVIDEEGHIVTRLAGLDPNDKHHNISITMHDGQTVPVQFIGIDCATGFAVLKTESPVTSVPDDPAAVEIAQETPVRILSADAVALVSTQDKPVHLQISQTISITHGQVRTDSMYSKARGAHTLRAQSFLSRNDGSVVTTFTNQVVGMAQYAGYGRAYLYPIDVIRDTIAKRVIERNASVPAGWLGVVGDSLTRQGESRLAELGLSDQTGVLIREVAPNGPAAEAGLRPDDVIIGVDEFAITGPADLTALLASSPAGRNLLVRAVRDREPLEVRLELGARKLTQPSIAALGLEREVARALSEHGHLKSRLNELTEQYKTYRQRQPSRERTEALRELEIEIRALHDGLRSLEQVQPVERTEIAAASQAEPNERSEPADIVFSFGIAGRDLTPQLAQYLGSESGILVSRVLKGSSADAAGIKAGDVITRVNDQRPIACAQLQKLLVNQTGQIEIEIVRNRRPITTTLVLQ